MNSAIWINNWSNCHDVEPKKTQEVLTTIEKDGNDLEVIVQQEQAAQPKSIDDLLEQKFRQH